MKLLTTMTVLVMAVTIGSGLSMAAPRELPVRNLNREAISKKDLNTFIKAPTASRIAVDQGRLNASATNSCSGSESGSVYFVKGSKNYKCGTASDESSLTCLDYSLDWDGFKYSEIHDYRESNKSTQAVCCPGDTPLGKYTYLESGDSPVVDYFKGSYDSGSGKFYAGRVKSGDYTDTTIYEVVTCSNSSSVLE